MDTGYVSEIRGQFHRSLLESILWRNSGGTPSNADKDNKASVRIANAILDQMASSAAQERLPGQTSGHEFERIVAGFVRETFPRLTTIRPGPWIVEHIVGNRMILSRFEQYAHLTALDQVARENPVVATALGADYLIKPDVIVYREALPDDLINSGLLQVDDTSAKLTPLRQANRLKPLLHASISCKWTLRSDRAQNARSEGLNLMKNRKGALPHVVVVTGEPLPSRIAALALGTGEIDTVYHFALPELISATAHMLDTSELVNVMVEGKRLKDISDLPFDLAI